MATDRPIDPAHTAPQFSPALLPVNVPTDRCPVSRHNAEIRILIVFCGSSGDILMATPILRTLRQSYPTAHITWLVEYSHIASIDANPFVDEIICWYGDYFTRPRLKKQGIRYLWRILHLFYGKPINLFRTFDLLISYQPEQLSFLPPNIRRAKKIGVFDTWRNITGATTTDATRRLFDVAFTAEDLPAHRTEQALLPLSALKLPPPTDKRMNMGYTEEDRQEARRFLRENGLAEGRSYVVVAPLTTWPSRCWPIDRYTALCDRIEAETGRRVVLIGSPNERPAVEALAATLQTPPILGAGVFSFRCMAALIGEADVLISGDTGPMHVAGAVGTPYVALFGSTPVLSRAPLAGSGLAIAYSVPCGPCDVIHCGNPPETFMLCMNLIGVDEAFAATVRLLTDAPSFPLNVIH